MKSMGQEVAYGEQAGERASKGGHRLRGLPHIWELDPDLLPPRPSGSLIPWGAI